MSFTNYENGIDLDTFNPSLIKNAHVKAVTIYGEIVEGVPFYDNAAYLVVPCSSTKEFYYDTGDRKQTKEVQILYKSMCGVVPYVEVKNKRYGYSEQFYEYDVLKAKDERFIILFNKDELKHMLLPLKQFGKLLKQIKERHENEDSSKLEQEKLDWIDIADFKENFNFEYNYSNYIHQINAFVEKKNLKNHPKFKQEVKMIDDLEYPYISINGAKLVDSNDKALLEYLLENSLELFFRKDNDYSFDSFEQFTTAIIQKNYYQVDCFISESRSTYKLGDIVSFESVVNKTTEDYSNYLKELCEKYKIIDYEKFCKPYVLKDIKDCFKAAQINLCLFKDF